VTSVSHQARLLGGESESPHSVNRDASSKGTGAIAWIARDALASARYSSPENEQWSRSAFTIRAAWPSAPPRPPPAGSSPA